MAHAIQGTDLATAGLQILNNGTIVDQAYFLTINVPGTTEITAPSGGTLATVDQMINGGSFTTGGSLIFSAQNGGTISIGGMVAPSTSIHLLGTYDPVTNSPSLGASGTGAGAGANNGYIVSRAGTVAVDSIGTVANGDVIFDAAGTRWVRQPYSSINGTMAQQNATAVAIAGGTIEGVTLSQVGSLTVINNSSTFSIIPAAGGAAVYTDAYGAVGHAVDATGDMLLAGTVVTGNGFQVGQLGAAGVGWSAGTSEVAGNSYSLSATGFVAGAVALNVGSGALVHLDSYGAVGHVVDAAGNLVIGGGTLIGNGFTLTSAGIGGPAGANILQTATAANNPGTLTGLVLTDTYGAVGLIADSSVPLAYATDAANPTTYDAPTLMARDAEAAALSGPNMSGRGILTQKPVFGYNFWIVYGQSQSLGAAGSPALTTSQPTDALMLGPTGVTTSIGTAWASVDLNFHPAISTNSPNNLHTGVIPNLGTISISGSGGTGTITQTGGTSVAWNSIFSVNDQLAFTGFPAPNTSLNNDTSANPSWTIGTISAVSSGAMTFSMINNTVTSEAGITGVSAQQFSLSGEGESQGIEGITMLRKLNLAQKQLAADASRLFVTASTGHAGQLLEQLRPTSTKNWQIYLAKGAGSTDTIFDNAGAMTITGVSSITNAGTTYAFGTDYTLSGSVITWVTAGPPTGAKYIANVTYTYQNDFGQPVTAAQAFQATAAGLSATSGLFMVTLWQGTNDSTSANTTYANYLASMNGLINDFETQITSGVFGQAESPAYLWIQEGNINISEPLGNTNDPKGMCVPQAQLDWALSPPIPSCYLLGGSYAMPRNAIHLTGNGYRWLGALVGKVVHRIVDLGETWIPLYMKSATYRGVEVLIDFHVPVMPLQIQPCFTLPGGTPTTWSDWGFSVIDASGRVPVSSVSLNGAATVLLTLARALSGSAIVRYADATNHGGFGNICDSDPALSDVTWVYSAGSGQAPIENAAGWVGNRFPLWNWCCNGAVSIVYG